MVNVISNTHETLLLASDGLAGERFIYHVNSNPSISSKVPLLPIEQQLDWIINYWCDQLDHVGLDSTRFRTALANNGKSYTYSEYVSLTGPLLAQVCEQHSLPITTVKLREI